jgi:hypothetical protein
METAMLRKGWAVLAAKYSLLAGVCAMLLTPSALWAVDQFTNVAIQDPVSGRKAAVTPGRALLVNGSVIAKETVPADFFRVGRIMPRNCERIAVPPANSALVVKTIAFNAWRTAVDPGYFAIFYIGPSCGSSFAYKVNPATNGVTTTQFEPGLAIPADQALWGYAFQIDGDVFINGYRVPASSVPAS